MINGEVLAKELYDYENDPEEKINLANDASYHEVLKKMQIELNKLLVN